MAIGKKRRVSKRNKISWRKNVDIKDVEAYLDDKRLEERLGKSFFTRKDDEIFHIDIAGNEVGVKAATREARLAQKKAKLQELPKCFKILEPHTAVPDPIAKRNRVRTQEEKRHPLVKKLEDSRKARGILKAKEVDACRNRAIAEEKRKNKPKRGEYKDDLWNNDSADKYARVPLPEDTEWLHKTTLLHNLKHTDNLRKKKPPTLDKKPSVLPAVELPHPGISYNPSPEDHEELLQKVVEDEVKVIKEEEHLNRVTTHMFTKVTEKERQERWLSEMSQGLEYGNAEEDTEAVNSDTDEYKAINPPAKNNKKTLKKRRKLKEARKEKLKRLQDKVEKKKVSDIYKLRQLDKQLETREQKLIVIKEKRKKAKEARALQPKQLSKHKLEEEPLIFSMKEDLTGNLRNIKPEGSILKDQFGSLLKRNILETTVKRNPKKAKVKRYNKASHRMGWEAMGY